MIREAEAKEYAKDLEVLLAETDEILANTEQNLVLLEKAPSDSALLQELFRAMHTLKGGAATLGLEEAVSVCHGMETVLDEVRTGQRSVTSEMMNGLFKVLDWLKDWRNAIGEGAEGPPASGILPVVEALQICPSPSEGPQSNVPLKWPETCEKLPAKGAAGALTASLEALVSQGNPVYVLTVRFRTDAPLLSVRCFQVLTLVEEVAEVAGSSPSLEDIENDKASDALTLYVVGEKESEQAQRIAATVQDVVEVSMRRYTVNTTIAGASSPDKKPEIRVEKTALGKTVRVDVALLDSLMNMVGELVIDRTRLSQIAARLMSNSETAAVGSEISSLASHLQRTSSELQDGLMRARLLPLKSIVGKFPRMVRDLSRRCGKETVFSMTGESTEMDRTVLEAIDDPLIHLLRNAVDHGIEMPDERERLGKPKAGNIRLSAWYEDNQILVRVEDDGAGMDPERIRRTAVKKGLITEEASRKLSEQEICELVFLPGLSTASETTEVSGRGVGMDVARQNLERVNGRIELWTRPGEGTQVTLRLPLTLSIMRALLVKCADEVYAIPTSSVEEIFSLKDQSIGSVRGKQAMKVRDRIVPLVSLKGVLSDSPWQRDGSRYALLTRTQAQPVALGVEELLGEEEIVVKELRGLLSRVRGVAGATILAEGDPAVILDINRIL